MEQLSATTTYSIYKCYRKCHDEIMHQYGTLIASLQGEFTRSGKTQHQVINITHRDNQFILALYYSPAQQYCRLYQLVAGTQYTEAFTYDLKTNKCSWYHDHFFYRYAMRFSLRHKQHHEVIHHYFLHNPVIVFSRYVKRKKNIQNIMAVVRNGVIYGYKDLKNDMLNYRTIIDNFSISHEKNKYAKPLRHLLRKFEVNT